MTNPYSDPAGAFGWLLGSWLSPKVEKAIDDTVDYGQSVYDRSLQDGLLPTLAEDFYNSGFLQDSFDAGTRGLDFLLGTDFSNLSLPDNFDDAVYQMGELGSLLPELLGNLPNSANPVGNGIPRLNQSTFDYVNADLAKIFGMDRNTAYQEALSNTAYQRAVADMQRAGLNPAAIFGNGRGSTAGGVGYVGSAGSAASLGSGSGSKLFSTDDFGLIASLAGLATAVVTKKPHNFWLGQQGAQAVMTTLNALDKKFK